MGMECYSETSENFCQTAQHVTIPESRDTTNAVPTKFLAMSRNISHIYLLILPASWNHFTPTHSIVLCFTVLTKTNSVTVEQEYLTVPRAALPLICPYTYSWLSKLHAICTPELGQLSRRSARCTVRLSRNKFCRYWTMLQHRLKRSTFRLLRNYNFFFWQYPSLQKLVAARSKEWFCGRSLAGIVGSNPAGLRMCVYCECCVLSGRGLCDGLSPTKCGMSECDLETSRMRRPGPV
jgi:hypothetical protein